jgi:hypothetical protein
MMKRVVSLAIAPTQWAYDFTLTWITVRPEAPLVFSCHMLIRSVLPLMRMFERSR